jgi:hypothetical protein
VLPLPENLDLPFFTYGAFKPRELAFPQIERFLAQPPGPASALGSLKVRDGLPLYVESGGRRIPGFIIVFRDSDRLAAYETICRFEPKAVCSWKATTLASPPVRANLLVGPERPTVFLEVVRPSSVDPVFNHGLAPVETTAAQLGQEPSLSAPPDRFDWPRFFRLQMAYLLLWSAIERYSAFAHGPTLSPEAKNQGAR